MGSFVFCQGKKKHSSLRQADFRDMRRKATKIVCTSTVVVSPGSLSSTPSSSKTVKTLVNTEEEPDDTEPAAHGDIRMEYSD